MGSPCEQQSWWNHVKKEADWSHTHPASLLKVDQTTLWKTKRTLSEAGTSHTSGLLRQTAFRWTAPKMDRQNSSCTYGKLAAHFLTDGLSDLKSWVNSANTSSQMFKHTDTISRCFLPPLGQAGPYPTWSGQSERSPSRVSFLALLPVEKVTRLIQVNLTRCCSKVRCLFFTFFKVWHTE